MRVEINPVHELLKVSAATLLLATFIGTRPAAIKDRAALNLALGMLEAAAAISFPDRTPEITAVAATVNVLTLYFEKPAFWPESLF